MGRALGRPLVGEDVRNHGKHVEMLGVWKDVQKNENERRVPPEARVLERAHDTVAFGAREKLRGDAAERLPPARMNRLAVRTRIEDQGGADVEEVGGHHRDDDEKNQNGLCEDVAVGVVAERHARLVFDGFRITAVETALYPAEVEEENRADDRGERCELLHERIELSDEVVGAQEAPEVEPRVEAAAPEHEAVEQQYLKGDEDPDVGKARQGVVGHSFLPKGVDQQCLGPVGDLLRAPAKSRVRYPHLDLPQPPKRGP